MRHRVVSAHLLVALRAPWPSYWGPVAFAFAFVMYHCGMCSLATTNRRENTRNELNIWACLLTDLQRVSVAVCNARDVCCLSVGASGFRGTGGHAPLQDGRSRLLNYDASLQAYIPWLFDTNAAHSIVNSIQSINSKCC